MSLLFIEGFDALADYGERFGGYYGSNISLVGSPVRTGSQSLQAELHSNKVNMPVTSAPTTVIFGMALRFAEALSTGSTYLQSFIYIWTSSSIQGWIRANSDGSLTLGTRIGSSTYPELGTSAAGVISINTWHYLEVKFTLSNSTAADDLIIKVDGVEVLNIGSGADTLYSGAAILAIAFGGMYNGVQVNYDDIYVLDEAGGVNDDFLGDSKIETLYPDGNGNYDQFLGSDANNVDNYLHVDEAQHDDDSTYVEESTAAERDSYTFDNMAVSPATIHGISVCGVVRKTTAGVRTGKLFYRRASTDHDGVEFGVADDFTVTEEIWDEDPEAVAAWTKTNIDASEFGIKVES